jgi:electron transport complex protein RnfC
MILKTFKLGGVHPPENKVSAGAAIQHLPLPDKLFVPLSQHLGTPAKAIVNRGDDVKTGQLIAKSVGFISANIHSPTSVIRLIRTIILNGSDHLRQKPSYL